MGDSSRETALAKMHVNTLAWLATHPHDYESLAAGHLGDALTRDELRDLADNPESLPLFIEGIRRTVGELLDGARTDADAGCPVHKWMGRVRGSDTPCPWCEGAFGSDAQSRWTRPEPFGCE